MPKSKHRRKPGEKATARPGRGKQAKLIERSNEPDEIAKARREAPNTHGLPLFEVRVTRS
jgi:hypothetical protein